MFFFLHRSDFIHFELHCYRLGQIANARSPSLTWSYQFLRSFRSPIWFYQFSADLRSDRRSEASSKMRICGPANLRIL